MVKIFIDKLKARIRNPLLHESTYDLDSNVQYAYYLYLCKSVSKGELSLNAGLKSIWE